MKKPITYPQLCLAFLIVLGAFKAYSQTLEVDTSMAASFLNKAQTFSEQAKYDSAITYYSQASKLFLDISQRPIGLESWAVDKYLICLINSANIFINERDYDYTLAFADIVITHANKVFGKNTKYEADAYYYKGKVLYIYLGQDDKALEYLLKRIEMGKIINDEIHPDVAASYFIIGDIYLDKGKYDLALEYSLKALKTHKELDNRQPSDVAASYFLVGDVYLDKGEFDLALEYHLKSLKIEIELNGEEHDDVAMSHNNIGIIYWKKGQYDLALEYYLKALNTFRGLYGEKHVDVAMSYNNIGGVYSDKGEYELALEYYLKSLSIDIELNGEMQLDVALCYNNLSDIYRNIAKYDLALEYITKALKIRKELLGEKHPDVAVSYFNLGNVYYVTGEYDFALENYLIAVNIYETLSDKKHPDVAKFYNNIGSVYWDKGEYELALEYHFKSLSILKEMLGEKHPIMVKPFISIGNVYYAIGEYELALEYYVKSLSIRKEVFGEKHPDVAISYNNIGIVYFGKGEYELAVGYYFKSLSILEATLGKKHPDVAMSYNNIGSVYFGKGDYELALEYHMKSLSIRKELFGEKHPDVAVSYFYLGNGYYGKGEYDLALDYYQQALSIKKELLGERHTTVARCYNNIGSVYFGKGDYELALEYHFKSLSIRKELFGEKHPDVAESYMMIGLVLQQQKKHESALNYYHWGLIANLRNYNDSMNVNSNPIIDNYFKAFYLLECLYGKAQMFYDLQNLQASFRNFHLCDTLITQIRKTTNTKDDKISLGAITNQVYNGAIQVCLKLADNPPTSFSKSDFVAQAFYFSEKNKASVLLDALVGQESLKFSGIPDSLLQKEHKLKIDIALYKKILAEQPDSTKEILFRDKLFKANRQYDELITVFEGQYPEYFELKYNRKPASVEEIQKTLDNKTAIISYFTGDSIITIFIITKKNLDIKTVPAIKNLADTIRDYRNGLIYTNSSSFAEVYKKHAFKMYRQLIPKNLDKEISNLIIIPDAELSMIPFETLLTENPEDKEWKDLPYLIKKYNISYSYSANLFYKTFPKEPTTKIEYTDLNDWLAFAPVFDDSNTAGLTMRTRELLEQLDTKLDDTTGTRGMLVKGGYVSPLPGTVREVQSIFKLFDEKGKKALVQIKNNANENFIKSGELKNYRFIHFATHGFVNTEKPELSGILLAQDTTINEDGILYLGEIYNLNLNADLTVLSACETGLGEIKKGEGLIGLTRALLYAGSKNIIVSLWKVADKSTSDLMIDFYKNLLETGQEKQEFSQALQQAKLKMINEGRYAHPAYWSPFILIGK